MLEKKSGFGEPERVGISIIFVSMIEVKKQVAKMSEKIRFKGLEKWLAKNQTPRRKRDEASKAGEKK